MYFVRKKETVNTKLFIKIIGGAMPLGGYWAWVTYFFAGTGFAIFSLGQVLQCLL